MHRRCLLLAALLLLACGEPAPPRIIEVHGPGDTRDPVGPYRVTAVVEGADTVSIEWTRQYDVHADLLAEPQRSPMYDVGESWQGDVPGGLIEQAATTWLHVEASNAAGSTISQRLQFRLLDPDGACLVDGECLPGEICAGGACRIPPGVCASDADCGQDFYCPVPGQACRFRPTVCAEDADCAAGDVCLDGRCAPAPQCALDRDCGEGRCVDGRCLPPARCGDDGDCPPGTVCLDGDCAVACRRDAECPPDAVCRDLRCVPAGAVACPGGCDDGLFCLPTDDRCVSCTADGHCPGGHCDLDAWACAPGERGRPCVPCGPQNVCGAGYACAAGNGVACIPRCNGECGAGCEETCAVPPDRLCGGSMCDGDGDCDSGVCLSGWCEPRQYCVRDADCAAGRRCTDGRCVFEADACRRPGDCAAGELCLGGRCSPGRPVDPCGRCTFDHECPSAALCVPFDDGLRRCAALCGSECPGEELECQVVDAGLLVCLGPDRGCPQDDCGADDLEPDDEPRTATRMLVGAVLSGVLCARDADWILLDAPAGAGLFVQSRGVVTLTITDSERNVLRELDIPAGGSAELALPEGAYFARLTTVASGEFVWDAVLAAPPPPACEDDGFEENDGPDDATVLGNGADIRASACPDDTDWYRIRTRERSGRVRLDVADGDALDVRLLSEGEQVLEVSRGPGRRDVPVPRGFDTVLLVVRCDGCDDDVGYRLRTLLD